MKKVFALLVNVIMIICSVGCGGGALNYDSYADYMSKEVAVKNIFLSYGTYGDDRYYFRKYDTLSPLSFSYSFVYKPSIDRFNCSVLVSSRYGTYNIFDYGSVTFAWGNIQNGLYYGYHEIENAAILELEFNNLVFNPDISLGAHYSYIVTKNTYAYLTQKAEIDEYASIMHDCIERALGYAQSIIYSYTSNITLW